MSCTSGFFDNSTAFSFKLVLGHERNEGCVQSLRAQFERREVGGQRSTGVSILPAFYGTATILRTTTDLVPVSSILL